MQGLHSQIIQHDYYWTLVKQWIKGSVVNIICETKLVSKQDVLIFKYDCAMNRNHALQIDYFSLYIFIESSSSVKMLIRYTYNTEQINSSPGL